VLAEREGFEPANRARTALRTVVLRTGKQGLMRNTSVRGLCAGALVWAGCIGYVSGCASKAETAWQAVHAVDALQTLSIAKSDCFYEANWFTRQQIGKHPSETDVVLWWAAHAALHYAVTKSLEGKPGLQKFWQSITLAKTSYYVIDNHRMGIRPFDSKC
jgi:hypothetical protein